MGPVAGADVSAALGVVAHPSHQKVLSSRGGDVILFVFMIAGLTVGMLAGWRVRGRSSRRLRLRLPHFHLHDVRTQDRLTWQPRGLQRVDARLKLAVVAVLLVVNLLAGWAVSLLLLVTATLVLLAWQRVRLPALVDPAGARADRGRDARAAARVHHPGQRHPESAPARPWPR